MLNVFRRNPQGPTIEVLYGAIVAQARQPVFYRRYGVADTVNGRLDLLILHLTLVFERLSQGPMVAKEMGQAIFDRFCRDMDDHLREQGVSDLKVPKEMRRLGEAFFGRHRAYISALRSGDDAALRSAVKRNVFEDRVASTVPQLAAYIRTATAVLDRQDPSVIASGKLVWPDPDETAIATEVLPR